MTHNSFRKDGVVDHRCDDMAEQYLGPRGKSLFKLHSFVYLIFAISLMQVCVSKQNT